METFKAAGLANAWVVGGLIVELLSSSLSIRTTAGHAESFSTSAEPADNNNKNIFCL